MTTQLFVNLHVKDLDASVAFFTKLGFSFNPLFTDENATCMIINDDAYVMLLVENFFSGFTGTPIPDPRAASEVTMSITRPTRDDVDTFSAVAVEGGAIPLSDEPIDMGFMYQRNFRDLDGHIWEIFWMDPAAAENGPPT